MARKFTPEQVRELLPNEIFVFGSNKSGEHQGGAARIAHEKFGAKWGVGRGLTGQSYALPTLTAYREPISNEEFCEEFIELFDACDRHPSRSFLLTKVGCGIAGFTLYDVIKFFWTALEMDGRKEIPSNLVIPREFDENHPEKA